MPRVLNKYKDDISKATSIMRPGPFGNPFEIGRDGDRDQVCDKYELWLDGKIEAPNGKKPPTRAQIEMLRGQDVYCCCAPKRCHGITLVKRANA